MPLQDLAILVKYLTIDKDGKTRFAEQLLSDPTYKACNGDYTKAWQQIAGELQLFGGDSVVNMLRGNGILYKEILCDVCNKLKVNYNQKQAISQIESYLLQKIISDSWEKMTEAERKELQSTIGVNSALLGSAGLGAVIAAINMGGFAAYQTAALVANTIAKTIIGKGLQFGANTLLMKSMAVVAGPIGIAISALMTLSSISSPAFRVTMPCVIQIAYMRQRLLQGDRF